MPWREMDTTDSLRTQIAQRLDVHGGGEEALQVLAKGRKLDDGALLNSIEALAEEEPHVNVVILLNDPEDLAAEQGNQAPGGQGFGRQSAPPVGGKGARLAAAMPLPDGARGSSGNPTLLRRSNDGSKSREYSVKAQEEETEVSPRRAKQELPLR